MIEQQYADAIAEIERLKARVVKLTSACNEALAALRYNDHWRETVVPRLRQQLQEALKQPVSDTACRES